MGWILSVAGCKTAELTEFGVH